MSKEPGLSSPYSGCDRGYRTVYKGYRKETVFEKQTRPGRRDPESRDYRGSGQARSTFLKGPVSRSGMEKDGWHEGCSDS